MKNKQIQIWILRWLLSLLIVAILSMLDKTINGILIVAFSVSLIMFTFMEF